MCLGRLNELPKNKRQFYPRGIGYQMVNKRKDKYYSAYGASVLEKPIHKWIECNNPDGFYLFLTIKDAKRELDDWCNSDFRIIKVKYKKLINKGTHRIYCGRPEYVRAFTAEQIYILKEI